jgi:hypothetical protein
MPPLSSWAAIAGRFGSQNSKCREPVSKKQQKPIFLGSRFHEMSLSVPLMVVNPRLTIVVIGGNLGFLDSTGLQYVPTFSDDLVASEQCDRMLPRG